LTGSASAAKSARPDHLPAGFRAVRVRHPLRLEDNIMQTRRGFAASALAVALTFTAAPGAQAGNPFDSGPIADFMNIFREQAIPRETVAWKGAEKPGTVVVSTSQRRLYYVLGGGQAVRYGVGVGRQGFSWSGQKTVTMKKEWPDWRPPAQMLARRPDLPRFMAGGQDNPLGARAMYLGPRSTASTARTSPRPWARRSRRAASA
jgi:lipoprotein-anchoring transpeptidase ErfK/SrfK